MTKDNIEGAWESLSKEKLEEMERTAKRVGATVRALHDECRADAAKAAELDKPWVLIDRLQIPHEHVPEATEQQLRQSFRATTSGNNCSTCELVVVLTILSFVAALVLLTVLLAGAFAPSVAAALVAAGFVLALGAVAIIESGLAGNLAGQVGGPVCSDLGYC